ncbi:MAG: rRNA pseudouridine synthase [Halobacteriovoraceae bacterium]|nr:rRNA pseudouridine synthase [Halobacteriovoraceae bacterium]
MADCGVTSRRKAEELICSGRVKVNGEICDELGTKVDPTIDVVAVDDKAIDTMQTNKVYIMLNKPRSVMTTVSDPEGRKTVMDFCKNVPERIYPVGRLDYLSEGLLLLTNDGELANKIMHPSFNITKVYEVKVFGAINENILKGLRSGVQIENTHVKPKSVRVIKQLPNKTWLEFRLTDGKNREIRKICEANNIVIDKLKRVAIENLSIEGMAPGKYTYLTKKEIISALGLDGKLKGEFFSQKKSINLKLKGPKTGVLANDKTFNGFKKDTYYETLKKIKEKKKLMIENAKKEAYGDRYNPLKVSKAERPKKKSNYRK